MNQSARNWPVAALFERSRQPRFLHLSGLVPAGSIELGFDERGKGHESAADSGRSARLGRDQPAMARSARRGRVQDRQAVPALVDVRGLHRERQYGASILAL
jgi:hypothetical protein